MVAEAGLWRGNVTDGTYGCNDIERFVWVIGQRQRVIPPPLSAVFSFLGPEQRADQDASVCLVFSSRGARTKETARATPPPISFPTATAGTSSGAVFMV